MKISLINKSLYPKGGDEINAINTGKLLQFKRHNVFFWMDSPDNPVINLNNILCLILI